MKIRKTTEYEIQCSGCGSLLRVLFSELKFKGTMDQRIPCPACGTRVQVIQGGMIASGMTPKVRDNTWKEADLGLLGPAETTD